MLYPPSTPPTVNDPRSTDRIRLARFLPLRGRPVPSPSRLPLPPVFDDALLGSAWRWEGDEERSPSVR